jgi:hypothetical protein
MLVNKELISPYFQNLGIKIDYLIFTSEFLKMLFGLCHWCGCNIVTLYGKHSL